MKRILLLLAMGLITISVTSGCNKSEETSTMATTNSVATNSTPTKAP